MEDERGEMRKSGSILRGIGMLLMFLGMFLILMVMFPFLYGINLDQIFSWIGLGLAMGGFVFLVLSFFLRIIKKHETFTFIKCSKEDCKYEEIRDFRKGDYIFKELTRNCKKCGSNLYVDQIAHLPLKKYHKKEYPIKDRKLDKEKEVFITKTVVRCDNEQCDFEEIRDFQENDVIFEVLEGQKCKKCNSILYVHEIYKISEEKFNEMIKVKT